tara:strand:+ start:303 stop:446 length:144 start_codon:yes stop_codon:yes gene_type:complete
MNNGMGSLKEFFEIKEKVGSRFIQDLMLINKVVNTLQEQDSRSQRVG